VTEYQLLEFEEGNHPARFDAFELLAMTGIPVRNVYFYVQRGLIPHSIGFGPAARYTYEHVVRLLVLQKLKRRQMTLREIKVFLDGLTVRELHRIANGVDPSGIINDIRRFLYRPPGSPPPEEEPLTCVTIADDIELYVGAAYVAHAIVRRPELVEAITCILDV
jgi:DNA-binding transcriptional MerR regulator